ncbi:hypothetical protein HPB50_009527 [Hyalomma asiaticum]|uniref:Uncharacterized protein n=1 Tax=Hyalomma asiaticum TaxID=266040 RepID=A0ACB7TLD3_HYAAI|nr:hypothetical protein HPB50_009527 [Hyalomma asiaticum]
MPVILWPIYEQKQNSVAQAARSTNGSLTALGCYGPNICGRDLIQAFDMIKTPFMNVSATEFADVFAPGLGLIKGPPVHLRFGTTGHRNCEKHAMYCTPFVHWEALNVSVVWLRALVFLYPIQIGPHLFCRD